MKFDIEIHKKTHHGYLEVMISPSGEIEYAIPSNQMYLMQKSISACMGKLCARQCSDNTSTVWRT